METAAKHYYRALLAKPGVQRVSSEFGVALQEIIAARRGGIKGEAQHRLHVRTGTERWCFRPSRHRIPADWELADRNDLTLQGHILLVPFGAVGAGPHFSNGRGV